MNIHNVKSCSRPLVEHTHNVPASETCTPCKIHCTHRHSSTRISRSTVQHTIHQWRVATMTIILTVIISPVYSLLYKNNILNFWSNSCLLLVLALCFCSIVGLNMYNTAHKTIAQSISLLHVNIYSMYLLSSNLFIMLWQLLEWNTIKEKTSHY